MVATCYYCAETSLVKLVLCNYKCVTMPVCRNMDMAYPGYIDKNKTNTIIGHRLGFSWLCMSIMGFMGHTVVLDEGTITIILRGQPDDACKMRYEILLKPMIERGKMGNGKIRYEISHPIARVIYGMQSDEDER
ncbi:hypothetical protein LY76DRAFT_650849 [Colletotrichum caudatum]|nr:hypothetical protein LY76DRAFT_650849 [Colletotrichum caudatum]